MNPEHIRTVHVHTCSEDFMAQNAVGGPNNSKSRRVAGLLAAMVTNDNVRFCRLATVSRAIERLPTNAPRSASNFAPSSCHKSSRMYPDREISSLSASFRALCSMGLKTNAVDSDQSKLPRFIHGTGIMESLPSDVPTKNQGLASSADRVSD